ncbi:MAG: sigma-70 family polymerase sigma factor [Conexibacter sp.]|nr:sigma-70 family polymerase sigma factor [Conexibacter sp.]
MTSLAPAPARDSASRDATLLAEYARTRDPALRDSLVRRYLPLARYAAGQYARGSEPFDDLLQVASIGLLKAIDRFDPERGIAFSSYALPTMSGELRRHFRDRGWAVRPPRDLLEQALNVDKSSAELQRRLGRAPTVAELATETGLDAEAVLDARQALSARTFTSLSAPPGPDGAEDTAATILDRRFGVTDDGFATAEARATLDTLLAQLPLRERRIVQLRFTEDLTQAEIGELVGVSQMQVSRLLRGSLERLRAVAGAGAGAGQSAR